MFLRPLALALALGATSAAAQELTLRVPENDALAAILNRVSLLRSTLAEPDATVQDIVAAARADYRRLLTGLYAEGYYGGSLSIRIDGIEAAGLAPLDAPASVSEIVIDVTPGPQFVFGALDIAPIATDTALPDAFNRGAIAQSGIISDAASAAISAWRDQGHAKAAIESQQISARHRESELDVALTLDPGPELRFGEVTTKGSQSVRPDRIIAIAGIDGGTFSPDDLTRAANRLRRTGAFSSVRMIEAETPAPDGTLPITVQVAEMPAHRIGAGAEYSTVDGLGLSGYWLHRNLLGGAESLRLSAGVTGIDGTTGGIDVDLGANFSYPRPFGVDTTLTADLALTHQDEPTFSLDQLSMDLGLTRLVGRDTEIGVGIGLARAEYRDSLGTRDYTLATLPLSASQDRRDDLLNPHSGYFADITLTPFLGFGDVGSGAHALLEGRGYFTPAAVDRLTLAARARVGSLIGVSADRAPGDYLFFSGGGDSVRGQGYQSLAVDLGGGNFVGGQSLVNISTEARFAVTETYGVVGFADFGYVGANAVPLTDGDWHAGAGVGLRYNTGIGPIRLDVATPVAGPGAGQSVSLYLGIGQAF